MQSPTILASLLVAVVAFAGTPAFAQETTATLTGVVTDESGGVLPGVTVVATHVATGRTFEFITTDTGAYTAPLLPIGEYEVSFTLAGFQPLTVKGLRLAVNDRVTVNGTMKVGGLAEVVTVTAGAALVQTTPALQSLVGSTQVQELPVNNRNFAQFATLSPGVSSDLDDEAGVGLTSRMSISVNGARRNSVNWLVDGVSNVDVGSNITLLSTPTLESIEEFKIITSSYAAEWPRSGGGVVNVVTKSGTSKFAGSAYEFFRNDALNANSFFRNQVAATKFAPKLRYNNFGYTAGGPVVPWRDKAFFFWSQEWRRIQRAPVSQNVQVPDPAWLTDATSPNYVPPAQRDPNAVRLLQAWPAPNVPGTNRYSATVPTINNTRQEVVRVDYDLSKNWRLTGRYTHDLSETRETGGLFIALSVPNIATTDTDVPGQVFAAQLKTVIGNRALNEFSYQRSSNRISTTNPEGTKGQRSDYGLTIPELYAENNSGRIPFVRVTGLAVIGSNQLIDIEYANHTFADNFSYQRGNHAYKMGFLGSFEQKNENATNTTQGDFTFVASGAASAFQNFLRGNPDASCTGCSYTEAEQDITVNLRFKRFEMFAQDTWRLAPNVTMDYGVRYSLYPPVTDANDRLVTFDPAAYSAASAPQFANATGSLVDLRTGDPLVGLIVAGRNSPYGRGVYAFKKNSVQPRAGVSWDLGRDGVNVVRGAYGVYYDQPLVGIFEQNSFTSPPFVNNIALSNVSLSNPGSGVTATTTGVRAIQATATDFDNPRLQQWNATYTRRLFAKAVAEVSYVGSRGDNLIRPTNANFAQPSAVVALQAGVAGAINPARPYRSYGDITMRETTARSRYHGLLTAFRYEGGRNGTLTLNYTLSRNQTDSTNDRDTVDIPQNPADPDADYADARTDRRHIFNASYVYELPFFREHANALLKGALGGWQVAGITKINSGPPVSRISVLNNTNRRGGFADLVGDPSPGVREVNGVMYWFDPTAFAPPADGTFGNSGRAPFRQPGYHSWDFALSKNFYPVSDVRLQVRADFVNAFNQVNWFSDPNATGLDNTCTSLVATCQSPTDRFGQLIDVRAPREIQLSLKLYW